MFAKYLKFIIALYNYSKPLVSIQRKLFGKTSFQSMSIFLVCNKNQPMFDVIWKHPRLLNFDQWFWCERWNSPVREGYSDMLKLSAPCLFSLCGPYLLSFWWRDNWSVGHSGQPTQLNNLNSLIGKKRWSVNPKQWLEL